MKYKKEQYEELFNIAKNRAINSLKHFFQLLDLDPSLFEDLYQTKIVIDYDKKHVDMNECALTVFGNSNDETFIYIGIDYFNDLIDNLNNGGSKQEVINSLAASIVHELIHVSRCIIIKEESNSDELLYLNNLENKNDKSSIINNKHKIDFELFNKLLDDSINNGFYNYFDDLVPLKVRDNNNGFYDIVAYSKKQNAYVFYYDQLIGCKYGNSSTMLSVGLELNSDSIEHDSSYTIFLDKEIHNDVVRDPADYIHQKDDSTLVEKLNKVNNQISMEETLVEVIAQLVICTRKSNNLDFETLDEHFFNSNIIEETLCYGMLKRMGKDTLKWFLTASRNDYYDDKLSNMFKEKYDLLLKLINELRNNTGKDEEYNDDTIEKVIDIINEKIPKKVK